MECVKAKRKRSKQNAAKAVEPPDNRQVLPADEYKKRIQKLRTSQLVYNFRQKFRRGD